MEDLYPILALVFVALGVASGTYGVLIGSGGGFIVAPLLIILFGMDHNLAVGTSLVTVFLASLSGSISYLRLKRVDIRSAILFSIAAVPGTIIGMLGLKLVAEGPFQVIFGSFLILIGLYIFFRQSNPTSESDTIYDHVSTDGGIPPSKSRSFGVTTRRITTSDLGTFTYTYNEPIAMSINGVFGFLSGFFGMGGGPLRTPTLIYIFRFPVYIATATSVFTQVIYTSIGSLGHIIDGNVDFPRALLIGIGVIVGAQVAVGLSRYLRSQWILRLLSLALLAISSQLIVSGLAR